MFKLDVLAEGVEGYTMDEPDGLYIPMIVATPPGQGHVGRYLDNLPTDKTIKVPNVMNPILAGMLERRGFHQVLEWVKLYEEYVPVYVRDAR